MPRKNTVAIPRSNPAKPEHPTISPTDEARWQLVLAHSPTANFLYAVTSTRIFCRTSCPSRRPRRANARFFDSAASAVAAGFRACRRCRPESRDPCHESPRASAEKQVGVACEYVRQRRGEAQLLDIAAHVGLSPRYLHGLFKQIVGTTPGAYAAAVRLESAGQPTAPMVPVSAVLGSAPHIIDLDDATGLVNIPPADDVTCQMPFEDFDWAACEWPLGSLDGLGCADFDQGLHPEWFNDFNLDTIQPFLETGGDSVESQLEAYSSGFVDPSLLG